MGENNAKSGSDIEPLQQLLAVDNNALTTLQNGSANGHTSPRKFVLDDEPPVRFDTPKRLVPDAHDVTLPAWRAAIRRPIIKSVEWESKIIAQMQDKVRTPWLDTYFVYTSSLGTHTFFMTFLPACFFFGYDEMGRGLLFVLALGVYLSSFIKDLVCSPRPFAPPVTRLTIGTHHLEYGFPSTHSTNSVSIALFLYTYLPRDSQFYIPACVALTWYTFSIVYGRLYTAMHSFTDCVVGVLLGTGIWGLWWGAGAVIEEWIAKTGWAVPLLAIPLCLIMVNQHPQPVDDCPCFEDAIAFVSVLLGSVLSRWHAVHYGFDERFLQGIMPGSSWEGWSEIGIWFTFSGLKMVIGIFIIFTWRILAKSTLHLVLPPIFRLLAHAFTLPNRRFYTPATDYKSVPSELGLRPIPSVIDLPSHLEMETETDDEGVGVGRVSGRGARGLVVPESGRELKLRGVANGSGGIYGGVPRDRPNGNKDGGWELEKNGSAVGANNSGAKDAEVKHYDADVLTKVIVYCGIAVLSCEWLPVMFEVLGWGVKSS